MKATIGSVLVFGVSCRKKASSSDRPRTGSVVDDEAEVGEWEEKR